MQHILTRLTLLVLTAALLVGSSWPVSAAVPGTALQQTVRLEDSLVPLASIPAGAANTRTPEATGKRVQKTSSAVIDYSNTQDGYVMVCYTGSTSKRLKAQVKGPGTTCTYDLTPGVWATLPLTDGNGSYQAAVFENVDGNQYATVVSASFSVNLTDEFAPYLRPNQYVDYASAPNTVAKAAELTAGIADPLEQVKVIYNFVVDNLTYDYDLAANVKSGYLPVLDSVLARRKGICFDYAALMTGMLRSRDIPCKLVIGYAGTVYHAWISVWTQESGWIDDVIFFDGTTWHRMDPTFASSSNRSASVLQYIGDGKNYTVKYNY